MKKTGFAETRIASDLKQQEAGMSTEEVARENDVSEARFTFGESNKTGIKSKNF